MSEVKFEKGSEEWNMFNEFWKMCQTYWIPQDGDEYWNQLTRSAKDFYKKYNSPFAMKLSILLLEECERKDKINRPKLDASM